MGLNLNPLIKRFARQFWPDVPNTTAPFNPDAQEAVQPQSIQPQLAFRRPQSIDTSQFDQRGWDKTRTGDYRNVPAGDNSYYTRPQLQALNSDGVATRPLVPPDQVKPLLRSVPQNMTDNPATPTPPDIERPQMKLTRPFPTGTAPNPDLSVPDAPGSNTAPALPLVRQAPSDLRHERIDMLSDPHERFLPQGQGGFKNRLVRGLKVGGEMALENLAQGGNPASALGAAIGGGVVGVADRKSQARFLGRRELGQLQQAEQYDMVRDEAQTKLDATRSENELRRAQIGALRNKPAEEQQAREEQERDNIRQLYQSLPDFDPALNPEHKQIADRATQLGLVLPKKAKTATPHKTLTFRRNAQGVEEQGYADEETGTFTPLKDDKGVPVTRAPKPSNVGADGLTAYQRLNLDLRRQGVAYQKSKDEKTEQQNQQKFLEGTSKYYAKRLTDAAVIAQKFDEVKAKALASDKSKEDRDYWLAEAESLRQQLGAYSDVYETGTSKGTDNSTWGYVKPKVGKSVREVMQGLGTKDPDEAVRYILDHGYVPVR